MSCEFPTDVIIDILSRLPLKTVARFACVSRRWGDIIGSSHFNKVHKEKSMETGNTSYIILHTSTGLYSMNLEDPEDVRRVLESPPDRLSLIEMVGCCNGILCLSDKMEQAIILFNPLTGRYKKVAVREPVHTKCDEQWRAVGFGYDSSKDDYKVFTQSKFRIHRKSGDQLRYVCVNRIYSLKTRRWRSLGPTPFPLDFSQRVVFLNGALHFKGYQLSMSTRSPVLLALDLTTYKWRRLPIPTEAERDLDFNLGALPECLCISSGNSPFYIQIWVMKIYGVMEWTKLPLIYQEVCNVRWVMLYPIIYSKCGGKILLKVKDVCMFWYDLEKNLDEQGEDLEEDLEEHEGEHMEEYEDYLEEGIVPVDGDFFDAEICTGSLVDPSLLSV